MFNQFQKTNIAAEDKYSNKYLMEIYIVSLLWKQWGNTARPRHLNESGEVHSEKLLHFCPLVAQVPPFSLVATLKNEPRLKLHLFCGQSPPAGGIESWQPAHTSETP